MSYKKILLLSVATAALLQAVEAPPMPPMPPMFPTAKATAKTATAKPKSPDSCQLIPPMVIHLPPPMEAELTKCKNELFLPAKDLVEKNLSTALKQKVVVEKIEIVAKFNQLYKITYNGGVILTNKTVDAFIKQ